MENTDANASYISANVAGTNSAVCFCMKFIIVTDYFSFFSKIHRKKISMFSFRIRISNCLYQCRQFSVPTPNAIYRYKKYSISARENLCFSYRIIFHPYRDIFLIGKTTIMGTIIPYFKRNALDFFFLFFTKYITLGTIWDTYFFDATSFYFLSQPILLFT